MIDAVDNRNKTKPRKVLVYRDIAIIDINSKTTKIFDGILSDQKGGKYRWIQFLLDTAVYHYLRKTKQFLTVCLQKHYVVICVE